YVAVDHIALTEEGEAGVEREGRIAALLAHDVTGDALLAIALVQNLLSDGGVVDAAKLTDAGHPEVGEQAVQFGHDHVVVLTDECADGAIDRVPVGKRGIIHERPERQRRLELAATKHPSPVLLGLDQTEIYAPQPHHRAKVALEYDAVRVVSPRLEL